MGGKSRKTGGVSKALIDRLKSGAGSSKKSKGNTNDKNKGNQKNGGLGISEKDN